MVRYLPIFVFFLSSCTTSSAWHLDAISAGDKNFNSARLKYIPPDTSSPLRFEMTRVGDHIESFLTLVRYHFTSSQSLSPEVSVSFRWKGEEKQEEALILEGAMKLRLSSEMTQEIIETLQKGEKVSILVDNFEQTLEPEIFSKLYEKLTGSTIFFQNPIKGPLQ